VSGAFISVSAPGAWLVRRSGRRYGVGVSYLSDPGQPPAYGGAPYDDYAARYDTHRPPYPPGTWPQHTDWPVPYGQAPYGFGYPPPAPPATAPAYIAAALFAACALVSFVLAFASWSGKADPHVMAGVIGVVQSRRFTGNIDFGISATMTMACTTLTFAVVLLARVSLARWVLMVVGGIVAVYYLAAITVLLARGGAALIGLPAGALLLWLGATVVTALPATARAMRGWRSDHQ
jgi:hypothetical protein